MTAAHLAAALLCAAALFCAAPAHADGLHCTTTALDADCNPLPDGAAVDATTLFRVGCSASTVGGEDGPDVTDFDPTADDLRIITDDPLEDVPVGLLPAEMCGAAVFALDGCLETGTYTIAHADDGTGWPALEVIDERCADGASGGGCQQGPRSGAPWPLLILFVGLLALGRRTPAGRP